MDNEECSHLLIHYSQNKNNPMDHFSEMQIYSAVAESEGFKVSVKTTSATWLICWLIKSNSAMCY